VTGGGRGGKPEAARGEENDGRPNAPRWPRPCTVAPWRVEACHGAGGRAGGEAVWRRPCHSASQGGGWDLAKSASQSGPVATVAAKHGRCRGETLSGHLVVCFAWNIKYPRNHWLCLIHVARPGGSANKTAVFKKKRSYDIFCKTATTGHGKYNRGILLVDCVALAQGKGSLMGVTKVVALLRSEQQRVPPNKAKCLRQQAYICPAVFLTGVCNRSACVSE